MHGFAISKCLDWYLAIVNTPLFLVHVFAMFVVFSYHHMIFSAWFIYYICVCMCVYEYIYIYDDILLPIGIQIWLYMIFISQSKVWLRNLETSHFSPFLKVWIILFCFTDASCIVTTSKAVKEAAQDALLHHSHGSAPVEWWVAPWWSHVAESFPTIQKTVSGPNSSFINNYRNQLGWWKRL